MQDKRNRLFKQREQCIKHDNKKEKSNHKEEKENNEKEEKEEKEEVGGKNGRGK